MVTAERHFNTSTIPMPKDISKDFYERFSTFLDDNLDDIKDH